MDYKRFINSGVTFRDLVALARKDIRTTEGMETVCAETGRSFPTLKRFLRKLKSNIKIPTPIRDYRNLGIKIMFFTVRGKEIKEKLFDVDKRPGGPWLAFYVETFAGVNLVGFYLPLEIADELEEILMKTMAQFNAVYLDTMDLIAPYYPPTTNDIVKKIDAALEAEKKSILKGKKPEKKVCIQDWKGRSRKERLPKIDSIEIRTATIPLMLMAMHEIIPWHTLHSFIHGGYRELFKNRFDIKPPEGYILCPKLFRRYYFSMERAGNIRGRYIFPEIFEARGGYETYLVIGPRDSVEEFYGTALYNFAIPSLFVGENYFLATLCVESCGNNLDAASEFLKGIDAVAKRITYTFRDQVPWEMYDVKSYKWIADPKKRPNYESVFKSLLSHRILVRS